MNITELSIRRPVTTIMLFVSMVAIGLIASFRLPLEAEPEATIPFFFVQLPYAGSTSEEVERNLVRPVEEALATMPGIESMNSRANAEGGSVQVRFSDWNKNIAIAASEARERIDAIRDQLPDDFRRYFVFRWSTSDREAISLRLTSQVDLTTRADLIERSIKQRLERLPGVARVEVEGVAKQEVLVAVTSAHRGESFQACEFLMDYLKTQAPFWKKEQTPEGARWVDARVSDDAALARWGIQAANA